jgi:predicted DCC family thiol-disulfide oxidoreductase YuxK
VTTRQQPDEPIVIVFDGECGMCSGLVRWLLKRDKRERLRFVSSASPIADAILSRHGLGAETVSETILAVRNFAEPGESVLQHSAAVVAILGELPPPWSLARVAMDWLPRWLRDFGYRLVAGNRYRIWGRATRCPVPTAAERGRFL